MRSNRNLITAVAILFLATSISAQNRQAIPRDEMNNYVISAKAGVVNLVEGEARISRAQPSASPEMLISGDELQNGDTVKTGANGRAEILLNPGCYLRLGGDSTFVFLFDNFTSDKLKLLQGSAVLEASAIEGPIIVETPKANFQIARDGLYRFNVGTDGKAAVAVRKGRVSVGDTTIKEGKGAVVEGGTSVIAKLNKRDVDALDDWSKGRAKSLIAANSKLSDVGMRLTLGMAFLRNSWIYDPFCRCYTFLPFAGGFASPYGWNYPVCNPYGYYYYWRRSNSGGWAGGGGNAGGNPSSSVGSGSGGTSGGGRSRGGAGSGSGKHGGGVDSGGGGNQAPPSHPPMSIGGGAQRGADRERPAPRRP